MIVTSIWLWNLCAKCRKIEKLTAWSATSFWPIANLPERMELRQPFRELISYVGNKKIEELGLAYTQSDNKLIFFDVSQHLLPLTVQLQVNHNNVVQNIVQPNARIETPKKSPTPQDYAETSSSSSSDAETSDDLSENLSAESVRKPPKRVFGQEPRENVSNEYSPQLFRGLFKTDKQVNLKVFMRKDRMMEAGPRRTNLIQLFLVNDTNRTIKVDMGQLSASIYFQDAPSNLYPTNIVSQVSPSSCNNHGHYINVKIKSIAGIKKEISETLGRRITKNDFHSFNFILVFCHPEINTFAVKHIEFISRFKNTKRSLQERYIPLPSKIPRTGSNTNEE